MIIKWLLLVITIRIYTAQDIVPNLRLDFFQNDYDVVPHHAEVNWYDKSYVKSLRVAFDPYNRTQRVMNGSCELLVELGNSVIMNTQVYKMMSNEYRFFPITTRVNVCAEYMRNSFGVKDLLSQTSNVAPCNIKKGFYYTRNAMLNYSKWPPHIPTGSYKIVNEFLFRSIRWLQVDVYFRIVDRPIDWRSIPKSNRYQIN